MSDSYAIVIGRFYGELAERLLAGAIEAFALAGETGVEVFDVPGAFELPLAASYAARSGRFAGVACLGAVIKGETDHYDYRLRRDGPGHSGGPAEHRGAVRLRRADVRDDGAGAGAHRGRKARSGPPRR